MIQRGCRWRPSDRSKGSRVAGKNEIHRRLQVDEFTEKPRMVFFNTCTETIAQIPAIPLDKKNPEDVDTRAEDHIYDALRYGVMTRPRFSIFDYDPMGRPSQGMPVADATLDINMAEEDIPVEIESVSLEDTDDTVVADAGTNNIIPFIMEKYYRADDYREQDEQRWLRAYRNYRGLYGSDVQFTEAEKSRVFIKVTKTKTLAAYGQIVDVLFANNKFPLSVEPTELPEGVAKDVSFDPKEPEEVTNKTMNHLMDFVAMVTIYLRERLREAYKKGSDLCKKSCQRLKILKRKLVKRLLP